MSLTVIKVKEAQPKGDYHTTALDQRKQNADFRLVDVSYKNVIIWKDGKQETVTDKQLKKLQEKYSWVTDF